MAILSRFRKNKSEKPTPEIKDRTSEAAGGSVPAKRVKSRAIIGLIIAPHITEKSARGARAGWYTFQVRSDATKPAIKRAVADRYGVLVTQVRVSYHRARRVRVGRHEGVVPGFKKAMVKVKEGQSIEFT